MKLPDPKTLPRTVIAWSLVVGPLAFLASAIVSPPLRGTAAGTLAEIARHPDRWYAFAVLSFVGSLLLVPGAIGLMQLLRPRAPWLGYVGGGLVGVGATVSAADSVLQLSFWQMAAPGADRAQMTALADRIDGATGASLFFTIGGLALIVGTVLLAVGLRRARVAPSWAAAGVPLSIVTNIAGFATSSTPLLVASCAIGVVAFGWLGRIFLKKAEVSTEVSARGTSRIPSSTPAAVR